MEFDEYFYGHGKLLISGEYFVLDGATSLALPTKLGQSLAVKYSTSYSPILTWEGIDFNGEVWFSAKYEFWHFDLLDESYDETKLFLQTVLRQVRKQNPHFLRDSKNVYVQTKMEFPLEWGLGSSSTLLFNIAQWAYISPFELQFKTLGGSGYDIACAQAEGPILYELKDRGPKWDLISFSPPFKNQLYFVYLGHKRNSREAIQEFRNGTILSKDDRAKLVVQLSSITREMVNVKTLNDFEFLMRGHEVIIESNLKVPKVKDQFFADFWGEVKSLGAWGGDFVLVSSKKSKDDTIAYFHEKNYSVIFEFDDLILGREGDYQKGEDASQFILQ
jgi:mevalonate kinase